MDGEVDVPDLVAGELFLEEGGDYAVDLTVDKLVTRGLPLEGEGDGGDALDQSLHGGADRAGVEDVDARVFAVVDARENNVGLLRDVLGGDYHAVGGGAVDRVGVNALDREADFLDLSFDLALLEKADRQALGHARALLDGRDDRDLAEFHGMACQHFDAFRIYAVVVYYPDFHRLHYITQLRIPRLRGCRSAGSSSRR